jgi:nucleoside-diphosphate-sugar epimerase
MYDEAKRYGEALIVNYKSVHGIDAKIARIFNTYDPRMRPDDGRIISNFITQALRGEPLTIYGEGTQTRSFQFIDDLISGLTRLSDSQCAGPMNIGNPEEHTVLELAELVLELTTSASPISFAPLPQDDPQQRRPDISLARKALNWEPRIPLRDGLMPTIAYYRDVI